MNACLNRIAVSLRRLAVSMGALPLALAALASPASAAVMISQVYGGGGNSGALYTHDYVELHNNGAAPVSLAGWSLQYASPTGTGNWSTKVDLSGNIPAGGYLLVRLASQNTSVGVALPVTPDITTDSVNIGGTNGKLALVNSTAVISGACPLSATIVDLVGYGTANCSETAAAPALSNTSSALLRLASGNSCQDSGNNSVDFVNVTPAPRNTSAPAQPCTAGGGGGGGGGGGAALARTIPEIQGSGATSPFVGQSVITSGVVTHRTSNGFFMQALTPDADPATSEGLFVFTGSNSFAAVAVGNVVQVTGPVVEFSNGVGTAATPLTQIANPTAVALTGSGQVPAALQLSLPLAAGDSFERYEGMLVTITSPMTVQQNFFQGRYGQVTIGAGGRHETPTNRFRPGASAQALADQQARGRLLLDDSSSGQNPNPIPYLVPASGVPRAGDTVASLTGVIDFGLATNNSAGAGLYRLQPTVAPLFTASNPRPATPPAVGGNVKVGSMNVLNFFTTFTNGSTAGGQTGQGCTLGTSTAASNCRGADNINEFNRQRGKIVLALAGLDADVVGLMEIQNNGAVATQNLVDALNAQVGAGTYAAVPPPAAGTGDDAIKVAMIYKPARLSLSGAAASDTDPINNRPTLAQTFAAANGERFTVVVNHLKSKGSCPTSGVDLDQGDGQGCWNATRVQQAQRLRSFIAVQQIASSSNDVVVIGDMNAYGQEDPIFELTSNGYVDQLSRFNALAYSYIFDGTSGRLDHGITSTGMSPKVAGAKYWQINADEASVRDYNQEFKLPATTCTPGPCPPDPFDASTAARSSDHDPVLLGLNIYKTITGTAAGDVLVGTPGDDRITGGPGADRLSGGAGANLFVYTSVLDGGDTITDFKPGADTIVLTDLLRSIKRGSAFDPIASGFVTCVAARGGALISVDTDGSAGPVPPRSLALLQGQNCATVMNAQNFVF